MFRCVQSRVHSHSSSFIMSDSDDDEFVSASEGEEEDHQMINSPQEEKSTDNEKKEESEEEELMDGRNHSDGDHSDAPDGEIVDQGEDVDPHSEEESEEAKEEKKEKEEIADAVDAVEESVIPEMSSLIIREEPGSLNRKESTSTSSGEGKDKKEWEKVEELEEQRSVPVPVSSQSKGCSSVDEGKSGWDDWGEETVEIKEESKPKVMPKRVEEEESADGWDDWGNEEVEDQSTKPVEKSKGTEILTNSADNLDVRREELLSKLGGSSKGSTSGSGWGWGGVLTGIGESFSSAVESSLGLPSAQELARKHAEMEKMENPVVVDRGQPSSNQHQPSFGGFGMFSGLVNGGIDVLESIGKKTFETITVREEEKGRRRFIFEADRGENLSDVLKELREKNEAEAAVSASAGHSSSSPRLPDMASSFERSDGMVHLEALELVATHRPKQKQSVHRQLMSLLENERVDVIDNDEDFAAEVRNAVKETGLPYSPDGIINIDHELDVRLRSGVGMTSEELFKEGVDSLVQFTAASVHLVSKLASLLAVMGGADFLPFVSLYRILSTRCTHIANLYMLAISASDSGSSADELGTLVLVEASTAIDFIRQAHSLLIPIIEVK